MSAEYAESRPEKISHEERATWRGGVHRGGVGVVEVQQAWSAKGWI